MTEARLAVRLVPRSRRHRLEWQPDGSLKAWVTAPPVDGAANAALVAMLAETLGVPRASVTIVRGQTSRNKEVLVQGLSVAECEAKIRR